MNTFEAKVLKGAVLRPFISAVLYFSFAMFDSLTEVDVAICDDVLTIDVCKFLQVSN